MGSYRHRACGALLAMLLLAAPPGWPAGVTDLFMSPAQEKRIGAEQHARILEEFGGAYDDPELATYVTSIGNFLALTSTASGTKFTFTVLNSPIVNAFALPGGYVYVTRGLVALADNEAELAGVLAHEIGHVAARHGAQRHTKNVLANLGLLVLGAATESNAAVGLGQLGASAVLSGYSRQDEYEADTLGVQYLSRAGFSPQAMSSFLARLQAHHGLEQKLAGSSSGEGFGFFATHPRTADRVTRAIEDAGAVRVSDPIVAQDVYFSKIDGIIYGDDPAQGIIQGRRFIHTNLGFEFTAPPGFALQNGATSVVAQGPEGAGIKLDMDPRSHPGPLDEYIRGVWAPNVPIEGLENIHINRMPGATALVRGVQDGKTDIRLLAVRFDSGAIFRFMFLIPTHLGGRLDAAYRETAFSFKRVSRTEAGAVRPYRIEIREVASGETPASIAQRMASPEPRMERFLVLNGLRENDRLTPGQRVKVVSGGQYTD